MRFLAGLSTRSEVVGLSAVPCCSVAGGRTVELEAHQLDTAVIRHTVRVSDNASPRTLLDLKAGATHTPVLRLQRYFACLQGKRHSKSLEI